MRRNAVHRWRMQHDPQYRARERVRWNYRNATRTKAKHRQPRVKGRRDLSLPGPPLYEAIRARVPERAPEDSGHYLGMTVEEVAKMAGTNDRQLRRWRDGENVGEVTAGKVVTRLDLDWWSVWPEGTEAHDVAARALGGEHVRKLAA
jgi:hypothetical protein